MSRRELNFDFVVFLLFVVVMGLVMNRGLASQRVDLLFCQTIYLEEISGVSLRVDDDVRNPDDDDDAGCESCVIFVVLVSKG